MKWITIVLGTLSAVVIIVGMVWTLARARERGKLLARWAVTALMVFAIWFLFSRAFGDGQGVLGGTGAPLVALVISIFLIAILALMWTPTIAFFLSSPLFRMFYDEKADADPTPLYSTAIGYRKRGNYEQALLAVREQLDQFPGDRAGVLLMAEIQAVDMGNLPAAEATLESFIEQATAPNAVVALNQIADWRLSLKEDPAGARDALERIRALCPGTKAAYVAEQRLAHLADSASIQAIQHPKPIQYVEFPRPAKVGEVLDVRPKPIEPAEETANLVKRLDQFPKDVEARERLAVLYAEHYHRMDLARLQLESLLADHRAPRNNVIAWLNRLTDLEIRIAHDIEAARAALQRIIDLDPNGAAAAQAQRRMYLLERELKRYRP